MRNRAYWIFYLTAVIMISLFYVITIDKKEMGKEVLNLCILCFVTAGVFYLLRLFKLTLLIEKINNPVFNKYEGSTKMIRPDIVFVKFDENILKKELKQSMLSN